MNPLGFIGLIFAALCVVAFVSGILAGLFGVKWMLVIDACWIVLSVICGPAVGRMLRGLSP